MKYAHCPSCGSPNVCLANFFNKGRQPESCLAKGPADAGVDEAWRRWNQLADQFAYDPIDDE